MALHSIPRRLRHLADVDLDAVPASGATTALVEDPSEPGRWVPGTVSGGGASSLGDLTDVDLTGLENGDGLVYDEASGMWLPVALTGGSVPAGGTTGQVLTKGSAADFDTEWSSSGGGGGAVHVLDEVVLSSAAANIDFTGIPATHRHLQLTYRLRGNRSPGAADALLMRVGGAGGLDTGANYRWHATLRGTSANNVQAAADTSYGIDSGGVHPVAGSDAGEFAVGVIDIFDYADTSFRRNMRHQLETRLSTTQYWSGSGKCSWNNTTDPIERIRLFAGNAQWIVGSKVTLYGYA